MKIDRGKPLHWLYLAGFAVVVLIARIVRAVVPAHRRGRNVTLYGHRLSGNLLALSKAMQDRPDIRWAFITMDLAYWGVLRAAGVPVRLAWMPATIVWLCRTGLVVSDHGLHAMAFLLGSPGLRFADVWHGIPFKGFDADDFRVQHRYDEVWVASPLLRQLYTERLGFDPGRVVVTGYARTDDLVNPCESRLALLARCGLGADSNRRYVLFAPTWKQDSHGRSLFPFDVDADAFFALLRRVCDRHGAVVLFRAHLNSGDMHFPADPRLVCVPQSSVPDTEALLQLSDVLVCDWSSIAFDYLLLDRPAVFLDVEPPFRKGFSLGPEYRYGAVVDAMNALEAALDLALSDPAAFQARHATRRHAIREAIYGSFADGVSGERCFQRLQALRASSGSSR